MILYTPLSETDIFPYFDNLQSLEWISYSGRTVCAKKLDNGTYELMQLMSTDPSDFLDETFAPGTIISQNIDTP